jgi:hypothetical protein
MAIISLEGRVAVLEAELARLKEQLGAEKPHTVPPWWERIYGTFANSPEYEEAMRLGRAYRESLRPQDDEPAGE